MKISCDCGSLIIDQSDYLSDKAYFVADQDISDMQDQIGNELRKLVSAVSESIFDEAVTNAAVEQIRRAISDGIRKYTARNLYQCSECGNLFVDDENFIYWVFAPIDETVPRNILRSAEGEKWKRPLRARWNSQSYDSSKPGSLFWGFGVEDQGFEEFDDYEGLAAAYYEAFNQLLANNLLRDAYFSRDGETVHIWSLDAPDDAPNK